MNVVPSHSHVVSRIVRFIETESRIIATGTEGRVGNGDLLFNGYTISV